MQPRSTTRPRAIITGASSGIGRELAIELAKREYELLLIARRGEKLRELKNWLKTPIETLTLDLADPQAIAQALPTIGHADVLIHNAGFGDNRPVLEQSDDVAHTLMQVHYFAGLTLMRHVLPGMLERKRGHIINIASIATKWGPGGHGAYAAAKCALIAMTQSLAVEHDDSPVHFSYVNPGLVRTEFFQHPTYRPLANTLAKRGLPADRVARRIAKLLDKPQLELCIPRHYRLTDLIRAISPRLLHRIVCRESQTGR